MDHQVQGHVDCILLHIRALPEIFIVVQPSVGVSDFPDLFDHLIDGIGFSSYRLFTSSIYVEIVSIVDQSVNPMPFKGKIFQLRIN